ncbi:unnamed protein product [Lampetra planeri]
MYLCYLVPRVCLHSRFKVFSMDRCPLFTLVCSAQKMNTKFSSLLKYVVDQVSVCVVGLLVFIVLCF